MDNDIDGFSTIIPFLHQYTVYNILYTPHFRVKYENVRTIQNSFDNGDRKRLPDDFRWRKNEMFHG